MFLRATPAPLRLPALPPPTGWRLDVLEPPQDATVRAGAQARFSCMLSEAVPVGEATWYINGTAVQPDDPDWMVTADGSHHALLLRSAQMHHAGEVTFAARDAVASARLTVLGGWLGSSGSGHGEGSTAPVLEAAGGLSVAPILVGSGHAVSLGSHRQSWPLSTEGHPPWGTAAGARCTRQDQTQVRPVRHAREPTRSLLGPAPTPCRHPGSPRGRRGGG